MHETYMKRCLDLAQMGKGFVAPNPMVGAVLVFENRIIGEGYHQQFGREHAEVNCLNSVQPRDQHLIEKSTLYVSLEPCSHFGKTPPCSDLILKHQIKKVVIATVDPNPKVAGKGIEKLKNNGVEVIENCLKTEAEHINEKFIYFHQHQLPYITLKFAQSKDGFIGKNNERIAISNAISQRFVHQLRAEHHAILIGNNTLKTDNPLLDCRFANGNAPIKIIMTKDGSIDTSLKIFNQSDSKIIIINEQYSKTNNNIQWLKVENCNDILSVLQILFLENIQSILVEGGAKILNSFLEQQQWNCIYQIIGNKNLEQGISAPKLSIIPNELFKLGDDIVKKFYTSQ